MWGVYLVGRELGLDGTLRPVDDKRTSLYFTQRRKGGIWAASNKARVERLTERAMNQAHTVPSTSVITVSAPINHCAVAVVLAFVSLHYLSFKKALILGVVLYLVGLFGDAWYGVGVDLSINAPYDFYRFLFNTTRDGLFFGYFFVVMGAYFVKTSYKIRNPFFWFFTFMVGLTFEVYLLRAYSRPLDFNLLLFALPASICLFSGMVEIDLKERKIYRWLRDASLIVYLIHPLIIIVLPMILGGLGLRSLGSNSLFEYFAVALISYAFSWILLMAARYLPFLKYLF